MVLRLICIKMRSLFANRKIYFMRHLSSDNKSKIAPSVYSKITRNDIKHYCAIGVGLTLLVIGFNVILYKVGWQTNLKTRLERILEMYECKDFDESIKCATMTSDYIGQCGPKSKRAYAIVPMQKHYSIKTSFDKSIVVFRGFDRDLKINKSFNDKYEPQAMMGKEGETYIFSIFFDLCSKYFNFCHIMESQLAAEYCLDLLNKIEKPSIELIRLKIQFNILLFEQAICLLQFSDGLHYALEALELYKLIPSDPYLGLALESLLSSSYISNGRTQDALKITAKIIRESMSLDYSDITLAQFYNMGIILLLEGNNQEALECFQVIVNFSKKLQLENGLSNVGETIQLIEQYLASK